MTDVKVGTPPLGIRTRRLCLVDYYTAPWRDYPAETPPVVMIATRELVTGREEVFSWHLEAELADIRPWEIHARQRELERRVLQKFADRLKSGGKTRWVHWGLDSVQFGFPALAQRAAVAGVEGFAAPSRQHDLSGLLKQHHGEDYVGHPRLPRLIELNRINAHLLLDRDDLTTAYRVGSFCDMACSLRRKVYCVSQVLTLALGHRLVVDRDRGCRSCEGCAWLGLLRQTLSTAAAGPPPAATVPGLPARPPGPVPKGEDGGGGTGGPAAPLPEWVGEHFTQCQYRLLKALWGRDEVPITEVAKAVYADGNPNREALDQVKKRVNKKLAEIKQSYEINTRRGEVFVLSPLE